MAAAMAGLAAAEQKVREAEDARDAATHDVELNRVDILDNALVAPKQGPIDAGLRRKAGVRQRQFEPAVRLPRRADRTGRCRQVDSARHRRRRPADTIGKGPVLDGDMADAAHRARVCPRIAYMPQGLGRNLHPDLSIRENIEFFGRLFGQSRAERQRRIAYLLGSTGLTPFADRPASSRLPRPSSTAAPIFRWSGRNSSRPD
jgi:hypothetical protein